MSAMKNNAKLIIRAKKVKSVLVLVQKDSFVSLSTNLKKKMFVNSQVSYFTLCYVTTGN